MSGLPVPRYSRACGRSRSGDTGEGAEAADRVADGRAYVDRCRCGDCEGAGGGEVGVDDGGLVDTIDGGPDRGAEGRDCDGDGGPGGEGPGVGSQHRHDAGDDFGEGYDRAAGGHVQAVGVVCVDEADVEPEAAGAGCQVIDRAEALVGAEGCRAAGVRDARAGGVAGGVEEPVATKVEVPVVGARLGPGSSDLRRV